MLLPCRTHRRQSCLVFLLAGMMGIGCGLETAPGPDRAPPTRSLAGAGDKPLIQTASGLAIADELVVGFEPGASDDDVAAVAGGVGAEVIWRGTATGYAVLRFPGPEEARRSRAPLAADPLVSHVSSNRVVSGTGKLGGGGISTSPGPEPAQLQWNLHALGLGTGGGWSTGAGVRVAVLDTGAAYEDRSDATGTYAVAPDLAGASFVAGYDFINGDEHANDDQGHGTHVTGVIAAQDGTVSLAPGVEIMPVKVLDSANLGTELALAEAIIFAVDNDADVINMSLSFSPSFFPSEYLQAAVDYASGHGVVMVAASGNHGGEMVTYPAAFRDVIAVGASRLRKGGLWWWLGDPWSLAPWRQRVAPYSNRGHLVDLVAPGGMIDTDVNGDGYPEAILAQTFDADPTDFGYYFYAGTSQAAAEVSGVAALMLAANPDLTPFDLRAVLGETASLKGLLLDDSLGRGYARADTALAESTSPDATAERPRYFAAVHLTLHRSGNDRRGQVEVEVLDAAGAPVKHAVVYGSFTGGVYASVSGITNAEGRVSFSSPKLDGDGRVLAFQVDAVSGLGSSSSFDRPRGTVRIDSCSLELLSAYASGQGISTSPGPIPVALKTPTIGAKQIDSVTLLNYSWGLATVPMAVAVDEEWFAEAFEEGAYARVLSEGSGISTSPVVIDPEVSFPVPVTLLAYEDGLPDECFDLMVRTFLGGPDQDSPVIPSPDGNCADDAACAAWADVLSEMWGFYAGQGISTSPVWEPDTGLSPPGFAHLGYMMETYVGFGFGGTASPVGQYDEVLDVAGLGLTPLPGTTEGSAGMAPLE